MRMTELCNSQREKLLPKWVEGFFASYPLDSAGFLRTGFDPFTNPVGRITRTSLAVLYDAAAGNDVEPSSVRHALARLMEVRAIQNMPPSRAVGALYLLKSLWREYVLPLYPVQGASDADGGKAAEQELPAAMREYLEAESRVDSLAMLAFDLYSRNREKVFTARVEEVKRSQSQVLRWAQKRQGGDNGGADEPEKSGTPQA